MPRGGYREPSNEKRAAVSNPRSGKRTDGMAGTRQKMMEIPSNGQYGYRKETQSMTAPQGLAGTPQGYAEAAKARVANMSSPVTPLMSPTQFPDRPVTNGYSVGPGMTPEPQVSDRFQMIKKYQDAFNTIAAQDDAPEGFKVFWQSVLSQARGQ